MCVRDRDTTLIADDRRSLVGGLGREKFVPLSPDDPSVRDISFIALYPTRNTLPSYVRTYIIITIIIIIVILMIMYKIDPKTYVLRVVFMTV